jgi:heme exporter protein CcmD
MDLREFLNMGGYAGFVWPAYGLTTLVLALNWWAARRREAEEQANAHRRMTTEKENRT